MFIDILKIDRRLLMFIAIAVLSTILIASLTLLVYSYSVPLETTKTVKTAEIYHSLDIGYRVYVKNSIVYNNRSIIMMGEPIYAKLFNGMNISYRYRVSADISIRGIEGVYRIVRIINTPNWNRSIVIDQGDIDSILDKENYLYIDFQEIMSYVNAMDKEIGVSSKSIDIIYTYYIDIAIKTIDKTYRLELTPTIKLSYDYTKPIITVSITGNEDRYIDSRNIVIPTYIRFMGMDIGVGVARFYSFILILISSPLLTAIIILSRRTRESPIDRILKKYSDIIITCSRISIENNNRVLIDNFEELVKISTLRKKPIAMVRDGGNIRFMVIDEDIVYEYIFEPSSISS
ncbi:hypothetical protein Igag_0504 [Ignisphaera aggregans DSM 17230]|uniref:DUF5305 domain-containing protein n=1 Tax=Ignisphaera aggregans (strain DSM 17230 / JCM 13409 / AQ1.S1) TaxID=583356 RepID=E0SRZ2_IGNAA|nr:hypothetical protein Igag_0504 [Ignisphaera aggregans DSM 17230]